MAVADLGAPSLQLQRTQQTPCVGIKMQYNALILVLSVIFMLHKIKQPIPSEGLRLLHPSFIYISTLLATFKNRSSVAS